MDDQAWAGVEALHKQLGQALKRSFRKPALLTIALDSEETAIDVVGEALGVAGSTAENKRLGAELFSWAVKHRRLESRMSSGVSASVYKHGAVSDWFPKPGMGDHYDALVRASPSLALDAFEKTLQAKKKGRLLKDGSADHEEKQKTKWALMLAGFIDEAGLPAAARVNAGETPDKMWVRAFGNRRSKTLRGRALIWTKLSTW